MKQVLLTLCGVVLFTTLLTVQALAGSPSWQSDLVCDYDWQWTFDALGSQRPFAAILHPSGDLYVSKIFNLPPNTTFQSQIYCSQAGFGWNWLPNGTTDANGTLAAQRIKGFATNATLGPICGGVRFDLYGYPPSSPPFFVHCVGGFKTP